MVSRKRTSPEPDRVRAAKETLPSRSFQVKPLRRNLPMLIVSGVALLIWLVYLAYIAWRTAA